MFCDTRLPFVYVAATYHGGVATWDQPRASSKRALGVVVLDRCRSAEISLRQACPLDGATFSPYWQVMTQVFDDIAPFAEAVGPMRALMGLDFGTKTIGVAVSDSVLSVASPLETIKRRKFTLDAEALMGLIRERSIGGVVLGLPLNMDGSEGPRVQSTRAFVRNFAPICGLPITFWDERLSTVAAERALLEADTTRKRRSEVIDHVAASYILQGTLDRIQHINRADI